MNVKTIILGETNCYLLSSEKAAVVIDPGYESQITEDFLRENSNKERMILITHGHFDHIGGALALKNKTGVKVAIGKKDNPALSDDIINEGAQFGYSSEPFSADILLEDKQILTVGDMEFKIFETPGHTLGSVCYYINEILFTGDLLFYRGFGNTCFHGGSRREILTSIKMLLSSFPPETLVYSGHGNSTTIGSEKNYYGR